MNATVLGLLVGAISACAQPEPLVELTFDAGLQNRGTLGSEAQFEEYVAEEGPSFTLGRAGAAVTFEASSRSGGTTTTKAGGAVVYTDPGISGLQEFTVSLWVFPISTEGPARLAYLASEWDFMMSNLMPSFKVTTGGQDHFLQPDRDAPRLDLDAWSFLAISVDAGAGTAVLYLGTETDAPTPIAKWEDVPPIDAASGRLEIGNLGGIRPFRGRIDTVRIHGAALSEDEVVALHEADRQAQRTLQDHAVVRGGKNLTGFNYSDVCFSTRWARDNALDVIKDFRANRVVWVYTTDADFVSGVHDAGATVQGAINSVPRTDDLSAYAIDLDGTKLVAPWMVDFNRDDPVKWGCPNQPAYRDVTIENAKKAIDAGVDWMQFDDWSLLASCHSWGGGCMCDSCMAAFREHLTGLFAEKLGELGIGDLDEFDYRAYLAEHDITDAETYKSKRNTLATTPIFADWQRESVRQWFAHLRQTMDDHADRPVPLSINSNLQNPSQARNFITDRVDFFLGETWSDELTDLAICAKSAEAFGTHQIVSPFPHEVGETRLAMAATYALGEFYLVPWDVWMGPGKDRHFGTVEDYGDLYHFVRDSAELLDGFENPGLVGVIVNTDAYNQSRVQSLVGRLLRAQVPFSFVCVGHAYYDQPLELERLQAFDALIRLDEIDSFSEADEAVLNEASDGVAIISAREATESILSRMSPIVSWAPEGIHVLPRVSTDPDERVLACHVLNRVLAPDKSVRPLRYVSFGLRGSALLGPSVVTASWHSPGAEPIPLETEELGGTVRVIIPEVAEWGIARIEFSQ